MGKVPNEEDVRVGLRIRQRRQDLGLSQTELANALGVTFQQVFKLEKGLNRIRASQLQMAARILGIPASSLLCDPSDSAANQGTTERKSSVDEIMQFLSSRDAIKLNKAYLAIKDENLRRSILTLVRAAAGERDETVSERPDS